MKLIGVEFLQAKIAEGGFTAKLVFNASGAIFFPTNQEHRDQRAPGITYGDNYTGNALAAMLSPGKIEIRNHRDFSEQRVTELMKSLLKSPNLHMLHNWQITYRGKTLSTE